MLWTKLSFVTLLLVPLAGCTRYDKLVPVSITGSSPVIEQLRGRWYFSSHGGRSYIEVSSKPPRLSLRVTTVSTYSRGNALSQQLIAASAESDSIRVQTQVGGQRMDMFLSVCPEETMAVSWSWPPPKQCPDSLLLVRDVPWEWRLKDWRDQYRK